MRLNQPTTAKPKPTSARAGSNLPKKGSTHEMGDQWGLVDAKTKPTVGFNSEMQRSRVRRYSLKGSVNNPHTNPK